MQIYMYICTRICVLCMYVCACACGGEVVAPTKSRERCHNKQSFFNEISPGRL